MADLPDTIFAHSSGRPPAAIAVVRISGAGAHAAACRLTGELPPARRAALRPVRAPDGELLDHALVLRFDGPASATGEDMIELHCHGGRAVVDGVLAALASLPGVRHAVAGEFTRRALENGRLDLTEAEGLADLLEAETRQQRRAALAVAGGALRRQVENWRETLVDLSAQAEAAIDYVGDEDETGIDLVRLRDDAGALAEEWREWLARPSSELLRDGLRVVLAGPPNAGKSSLLNALVGHDRAIVTEIAGTTRDVIEVPVALGSVPLMLVDTAGLRDTEDAVEQIGVSLAKRQTVAADILVWLGDRAESPEHAHLIHVHAQADRNPKVPDGALATSVVTGKGVDELRAKIIQLAGTILPAEGEPSLNRRQAEAVQQALTALSVLPDDLLMLAESFRYARTALDWVSGRVGIDDVLDALFGRFCLGK